MSFLFLILSSVPLDLVGKGYHREVTDWRCGAVCPFALERYMNEKET
jgi:hypothetical protein